ncbi:MAG: hypothetical protein M3Z95_07005 [Actinomycetota bacterium]|nr:hypothetical protein [Actinomycetota bacterium]
MASDIPSHGYVADSMPGCCLAARDATTLADAVLAEIVSELQERSTRLARSCAYVERELSVSGWAERLVRLYEEILRGRRNRPRQR